MSCLARIRFQESSCNSVSISRRCQPTWLSAVFACGLAIAGANPTFDPARPRDPRVGFEVAKDKSGVRLQIYDRQTGRVWSDLPYVYRLKLEDGRVLSGIENPRVRARQGMVEVVGNLRGSPVRVLQRFLWSGSDAVSETVTLYNRGTEPLKVADIEFGLAKKLGADTTALRLVAVPYRRQSDGKLHDYSVEDLTAGRFSNSDWANDATVEDQQLVDHGKLRSEAWAWTDGQHGLFIAKYNREMIEYSIAAVEKAGDGASLRFGGVGLALYREPRPATFIRPHASVTFGITKYTLFDGGWPRAYDLYRQWLRDHGHGFPPDYNPPLNWNELFDVGWYHSDREQLFKHYTRQALFDEAAKARDIGCDLLYLDPGWEVCEGTTLWDEQRLGKVADFARELKQKYGLRLGYRTIGRVYRDEFPNAWYIRRSGQAGAYSRPLIHATSAPSKPAPLTASDGRRNLALLPEARANASSVISGYPDIHAISHLNDGYYGNPCSWISAGEPSWAEIDLGGVHTIAEIAIGSDQTGHYRDRAITRFDVLAASEYDPASDSSKWTKVFAYDGPPLHTGRKFKFDPVRARWVRIVVHAAEGGAARIDELGVYESAPAPANAVQPARRRQAPPVTPGNPIGFWEVCTQCKAWQKEKLERILAVTGGGADFMMFDEFDWRGPCYDPNHGHPVPSTPEGHVRAVYGLIEATRAKYPHLLVEAHDPVWPWTMRYTPTYWRQGFAHSRYQENWAFEFMWNPIEDLKSGKALCLYYYNLGCDIPLYNHITMEGDNDACLAFWWYASTVRHLGIGGKKGLNSKQENETRYRAYKNAVAEYNRLREFYARGRFVGIDETAHLHVHPKRPEAVLNVFNLTDTAVRREVRINLKEIGLVLAGKVKVAGCRHRLDGNDLMLEFDLPALSPGHAVITQ